MHVGHGDTRDCDHEVVYVDEEALPEEVEWAFIDLDGHLYLAVKRGHWSPELMAEAWTEYASAC